MTTRAFHGRQSELETLDRFYHRDTDEQMIVLSGRWHIGKTALINQWLATREHDHIVWTASRTSRARLLRSFSQKILAFQHPGTDIERTFSYPSWEQALVELAAAARSRRVVLVIDEVPDVFEADPSLAGALQCIRDYQLKHSLLFLVLIGSHRPRSSARSSVRTRHSTGACQKSCTWPPCPFAP